MEQVLLIAFIGVVALIAIGQSAHHGSNRSTRLAARPQRPVKQNGAMDGAASTAARAATTDKDRPTQ